MKGLLWSISVFKQLDLSETKYAHLNPKGKTFCYRNRGYVVLMLSIKFVVFTQRFQRLLLSRRYGVLFSKANTEVANNVIVINEIEKEKAV